MRIGSLSGYGGIGSVYGMQSSERYSISSVHGNPKSLQPVSGVNQDSEASKPLAILKKEKEASQYISDRDYDQSMTAAEDYLSVMQQMMQGRDPQSLFIQNDENITDATDQMRVDFISNRAEPEISAQESTGNEQNIAQNNTRENGSVNPYQIQRAMAAYLMA